MNIKDIVSEWLTKNGYSGLYNGDEECGCVLDDLFPCGEPRPTCEPGHKVKCTCAGHRGWHIAPEPTPDTGDF